MHVPNHWLPSKCMEELKRAEAEETARVSPEAGGSF